MHSSLLEFYNWRPKYLFTLGIVTLLGACGGSQGVAPVGRAPDSSASRMAGPAAAQSASSRAGASAASVHQVSRGETLYAIAWRYGFDYRELAGWNGVATPYTIYPGQRLRLSAPAQTADQPRAQASVRPPVLASPRALPVSPKSAAPKSAAQKATRAAPARVVTVKPKPPAASKAPSKPRTSTSVSAAVAGWSWPTKGNVVTTFAASGGKGIDIAGQAGQAIVAAASGDVVYSGSGLRGYGQLIIVKHNKNFLSAYAHNKKLHVAEGDKVVRGQWIADMGRTGSEHIKLHFEIRKSGKPVDPFRYIPRKPGRRS